MDGFPPQGEATLFDIRFGRSYSYDINLRSDEGWDQGRKGPKEYDQGNYRNTN